MCFFSRECVPKSLEWNKLYKSECFIQGLRCVENEHVRIVGTCTGLWFQHVDLGYVLNPLLVKIYDSPILFVQMGFKLQPTTTQKYHQGIHPQSGFITKLSRIQAHVLTFFYISIFIHRTNTCNFHGPKLSTFFKFQGHKLFSSTFIT